jgi:hypothetical protein
MSSNRGPLEALSRLASREASGEFICNTTDSEAHVFLLKGKVAWAFDSHGGAVFWREILERCATDMATIRAVVEDCKRTGASVTSTVVEWGIAKPAQVRAAMERQIQHTLESLHARPDGQHIFLERSRFAEANTEWTFDLVSFALGHRAGTVRPPRTASVAPPAAEHASPVANPRAKTGLASHSGIAKTLFNIGAIGELSPAASAVACVGRLRATLVEGADLCVAKTSEGWVIGAASAPLEANWFVLKPTASLGVVFSSLLQSGFVARAEPRPAIVERDAVEWIPSAQWRPRLEVVKRFAEVRSAFVLGADGAALDAIAPSAHGTNGARAAIERARGVAPALDDPDGSVDLSSALGRPLLTAVALRGDELLLGARVGEESCWVSVARETHLGVAWSLLAALLRATRVGG